MTSRPKKDAFSLPPITQGNFYRHLDSGCYQVISRGKETETGVEMVAYIHRYPLDPTWSFRTAENFDEMVDGRRRFTPITIAEAETMMAVDRATAQRNLATARATRRATRSNPPPGL
jgi:hypothetical protein